jgi:hypothetical protein
MTGGKYTSWGMALGFTSKHQELVGATLLTLARLDKRRRSSVNVITGIGLINSTCAPKPGAQHCGEWRTLAVHEDARRRVVLKPQVATRREGPRPGRGHRGWLRRRLV